MRSITLSGGSKLAVTSAHLGHGAASRTCQCVAEMGTVALSEALARVGVVEVLTLSGAAGGVRKVGDKHVWQRGEGCGDTLGRSLAGSAADFDRSTVHVELTVADLVKPGPGEGVLAIRNVGRHLNRKGSSSVTVGVGWREVASYIGRATANDTVDDLPLRLL